jgi:hypothetical protein
MNQKTKQIVIRRLLASLMEADLSTTELRDIAHLFESPQFPEEFGRLLLEVLAHFDHDGSARHPRSSNRELEAYSLVQQRRMPKESVARLMDEATRRRFLFNQKWPLRELLKEFSHASSPAEFEKFLDLLRSNSSLDPFLKGISERD